MKGEKRNLVIIKIVIMSFIIIVGYKPIWLEGERQQNAVNDISARNIEDNQIYDFNEFTKKNQKPFEKRTVFLTFDDGPSPTTKNILDVLKKYKVQATFFVVGNQLERNAILLKDMKKAGMSILPHTYTHVYNKIYSSVDAYMEDFFKCSNLLKSLIGGDYSKFVRLPGGSYSLPTANNINNKLKNKLKEQGINYIDWNIDSYDSNGINISAQKIANTTIQQFEKNMHVSIALFHDSDSKLTTAQALPKIIEYLKLRDYQFRTFEDLSNEELEILKSLGVLNAK